MENKSVDELRKDLLILKAQHHAARTDVQRAEIDRQIKALSASNPDAFAVAMVELAGETANRAEELSLRDKLKDILPAVSVAYIARTYFGRTRQWLYQRINGGMVNGKPAKFTPEELERLEDALQDIGEKLSSLRVSP